MRLAEAVQDARKGAGSLVLLSGEAGIGKSRLAADIASEAAGLVLQGAASSGAIEAYGPFIAALRGHLRSHPEALDELGPLSGHLALLLPELGSAAAESDRRTIFEAIRSSFAQLAGDELLVVILDDLQWADEVSLELLASIAPALRQMRALVIATYRSEGLPRDHMLRWLRNELRRGGELEELVLDPLDTDEIGALLGELLPTRPAPSLVRTIQDRTQGSPFFIEELVGALVARGALQSGRRGLELSAEEGVPVPDTVRDAVLMGVSQLSEEAGSAAEAAAVAGQAFDIRLAAELSSEAGLVELIDGGQLVEGEPGRAAFRHALTREALYAEVPWLRRRTLHRSFAEALDARAGPSAEIAAHWQGAGEAPRARQALLQAAREAEALHAFRDAAKAGRTALEEWPEGDDEELRIEALERYARCSELAGELAEAGKAWRELSAVRSARGERLAFGETQDRLASVLALKGEREQAFAARRVAAEAYADNGRPADAAIQRLTMANHRRAGARYSEAIELSEAVIDDARTADRLDIEARALGVMGVAQAKGGDFTKGLATVRGGLALALERELTPVAAELYQRLSLVLYDSADYRRAEEALDTALGLCRASGDAMTEEACVTCLIYVLRERGDWPRACELGQELVDSGTAVWVAEGLVGAIHAFQGKFASARRMLSASRAVSSSIGHYNMFMDATTGLAHVSAAEGATDEAAEHCRTLLDRWQESEDHHYAVWGIRWAAVFFAQTGDRRRLQACTEALSSMVSAAGHQDALAALAQAIGETALLEGESELAADQLSRALDLHRNLGIPHERAQIELRAGVALAAAGEREQALERLSDAYRTARKLGARPLAAAAAREVAELGDSVAQRLGSRAAQSTAEVSLTRRELEVLGHVSVGRTNREIAEQLYLSPRTVDMHVRNILRKLECRSRVEATHRAGELGLLENRS